jgi:hypothetical protein
VPEPAAPWNCEQHFQAPQLHLRYLHEPSAVLVRFDSIRGVRIIRARYPLFASTATCRAVTQRSTSNSPSFLAHFARLTRRANCHSSRCGRQAYEILRWVIYIKTLPSCQSCQFSTTHLRLRSQPSCGRRHRSLSFPLHPHQVSLPTFALHVSTSDTSPSSHLIPNPVRHFHTTPC